MPKLFTTKNISLFALIFLLSCRKDKAPMPVSVTGQWQWVATYAVYPLGPNNPLTPQNTGIPQTLIFNEDHTYKWIKSNSTFDSGTYSTGHGSYTPYTGAGTTIYDSIQYYHNGVHVNGGVDYYIIESMDTLNINAGLAGQYAGCYTTIPYTGSGIWKKQ